MNTNCIQLDIAVSYFLNIELRIACQLLCLASRFFFITAWWNLQDKLPFSPFSINGRNVWVSEMFKKTFREFLKKKIFFVNRPCLRTFQNFNFFLDRIFQREIKSFSSLSTLNFRDFLELNFLMKSFPGFPIHFIKLSNHFCAFFQNLLRNDYISLV